MTTKPHIPIEMIEPEAKPYRCCNHDCEQSDSCPARRANDPGKLYLFGATLAGFLALVVVLMLAVGLLK